MATGVWMSRDDEIEGKLDASAASFTFKPAAQAFVPTVASAAPFYPTSRSGYVDTQGGATEPLRAEAVPKKQSFADLGLDSLGFVSDEECGDLEELDTASPLTKQRRDEVVQQLEGGMLYNQRRAASGDFSSYLPAPEFHPQAAEYHPQAAEFHPQAAEFHPQAQEFHPQVQEYHPQQQEYGYYPRGGYDETGYRGESYHDHGYNGGYGMDDGMDESEFLTFLMESYRGYSLESLTELLQANNGDIALTVEILAELDVEVEPPTPPALDDESTFPTLGGCGGASAGGAPVRNTAPPATAPRPTQDQPFTGFTISGGMSNVREGVTGGSGFVSGGAGSDDSRHKFADRLRIAPVRVEETRDGISVGYGSGNFSGRRVSGSQPWVETGDAAGAHAYASTREDASGHLRARNVCFQQATRAFLTGNRALAKDLSRKGREHARLMATAHAATETAHGERNTNHPGVGGGNSRSRTVTVDLHGLRVPDAIAVLHRELGECAARGDAAAHVLVGTAAHHKGSTRLPDAVNEYLTHRRCRFWEPQAGLLEVDVASGDFFT